jgi:serine/threonine-protein kinase
VTERTLSDRYRLEGRIGQGGMAIVYAGMDTVLRRRVAIKMLRDHLAADADFVARFYSEAQHAAKLSHPNIVSIYDVGREGDSYYIVMELVDGATLGEMLENGTRLPEGVAIDFGAQICNGLSYAHRQGLLHRDIKPANILVTKDDVVKLSDFGIARAVSSQTVSMTQPGMVMGSVYYISPEQAQGHELAATSDLYSFGVVLYQMLAGSLPYTGESPITIALKHVSSPVPELDLETLAVAPALAAIVRKLLQKTPTDRFASAIDVARALRQARENPLVTLPFASPAVARTIPSPKPRPSPQPDHRATVPAGEVAAVDGVRQGPNRVLLVTLAIFVLVAAVALGYFATSRPGGLFGGPRTIALTNVVGTRADDASRALADMGFTTKIETISSERVAAHLVIKQSPAPNGAIAPGTLVTLTVSAGPPRIPLMDVRQFSSDDAQRYLKIAKLVPRISSVYDASPKGTVLSQKPAAGTSVPIHSSVALVVSLGMHPVDAPDLVSLTLADARAAAAARHLRLVVGERDPSDSIPADVVTSQNPQAGSQIDRDGTIDVVISSGAPQITVPYVGGKSASDAVGTLGALGIAATIEYVVDPSAAVGTVLKQTPEPNTAVRKGSALTLAVAVPGSVPDVAGKSPDDARALLQNAGYKIGNNAYVQEGTEGSVARTEPVAGSSLRPGETVTLYVSGTPTAPQ